tara:strand:+ start:129 stop:794 length:666 start_codon:yes stop_codon:yes gene_type:complete
MYLDKKNINLLIDFDSTFVSLESLDIISQLSIKNDKSSINKINKITDLAMRGEISFSKALNQRLEMLNINKELLEKTIIELNSNISSSFNENKDFFINNYKNIYIISGGFKELIFPIVKKFKISYNNIYANEFVFSNDKVCGINKNNVLSKDQGKVEVAKSISGKNIIIGDGYTDYEVKKYKAAELFIQFIENINRTNLNKKADIIADDFKKIIKFVNNIK